MHILLLLGMASITPALGVLQIRGINKDCFARGGDVLLGFLTSTHQKGPTPDEPCLNKLVSNHTLQTPEAFMYVVEKINSSPEILPNISLGFVMLDDCQSKLTYLAKSLYLIPDEESPTPAQVGGNCSSGLVHFPVIGVLGAPTSDNSVQTAGLMTVAETPILSTFATSEELSDQSRFEYFVRLSPPDKYQSEAILDLIEFYGWTYFQLIFSEGSYGEHGGKAIEKKSKERGLCMASSTLVYYDDGVQQFLDIIDTLIRYRDARAVVLFLSDKHLSSLFLLIAEKDLQRQFIFIGSDTMSFVEDGYGPGADGAFVINFLNGRSDDFDKWYLGITPAKQPDNPWIYLLWEMLYGCQWSDNTCDQYMDVPVPSDHLIKSWVYKTLDSVTTLVMGLDSLIKNKCPAAFQNSSLLRECVKGPDYLHHIRHLNFQGVTGRIQFDDNIDMVGQYVIKQYSSARAEKARAVAVWDKNSEQIEVIKDEIDWMLFGDIDPDVLVPVSVCSKPCGPFQYVIQKELPCCWECRNCRENEIIAENYTSCVACGMFTWPDVETKTLCEDIPPEYLRPSDSITIGLLLLTVLGIIMALSVAGLFVKNRRARLIKASSRDLMVLILCGILLAFVTNFALISAPSAASCTMAQFGFTLSVCLIYAPLLVKTNRVYRIFSAGRRGNQRPGLISSRAQLTAALMLIAGQVVITVVVEITHPPRAVLKMPVPTERYVELICEVSPWGFLGCLSYNLLFIVLCSAFGFLTRKLPENFNESWFIFVSVSTTAFLWIVFLPTYYTTFYGYYQAALLVFCLFLNALLNLLCLYVPKLYAIYFIDEEKLLFGVGTMNTTMPVNSFGNSSTGIHKAPSVHM